MFEGGLHHELPIGTGRDRHHLIPQQCLRLVAEREGVPLDPDFGPAILIDPADHRNLLSSGRDARHRRWRAITTRLLLEGKWEEALEREIGDVERVAPGKYTEALNEAREHGRGLWPERRNDQLKLDLEAKPAKRWSPMDSPPGWDDWKRRWREEMESSEREKPEGGPRIPPPQRRPDRDRGIGD